MEYHYTWLAICLKKATGTFFVLVAFLFFVFARSLLAAEYFVSTTGNNANSGGLSTPWRTITYGVSRLSPGDVLTVRGGTYAENPPGKAGSSGKFIEVRAFSGETVIVKGYWNIKQSFFRVNGLVQEGSTGTGVLITEASDVQFVNCTVRNNVYHGFFIRRGAQTTVGGFLIKNCSVTENGQTAVRAGSDETWPYSKVHHVDGLTVEDSDLSRNLDSGLGCSNCRNLVVRRTKLNFNSGEDGMDIKQYSHDILIEDNVVDGNAQAGILINAQHASDFPVYGMGNVIVRRNIVRNNGQHGIRLNSKETNGYLTISHNFVQAVPGGSNRDGIYLFRGINVGVYNNVVIGGNRAFVGQCLRNSIIKNNIFVDSPGAALHFQGSSADCTGYENGLITENHNNFQSTGSNIITWINGKTYTPAMLTNYRADTGQGSRTMSTKPLFANTSTYELAGNSPMIDAGVVVDGMTNAFDGLAPDLGYKEFTSASVTAAPNPPTALKID